MLAVLAHAQTTPPKGEIMGAAWEHTAASLAGVVQQADVVLPAAATGGAVFTGKFKDAPTTDMARVPVVLFLHGSSGLGLKAIGEWQQWLASHDVARYERMHALRASEMAPTLAALKGLPKAAVVLVPDAPHTLLNFPAARHAVAGFLAANGLR